MDMKYYLHTYQPTSDDLIRFLSKSLETDKLLCKFCDCSFRSREGFKKHYCYTELASVLEQKHDFAAQQTSV